MDRAIVDRTPLPPGRRILVVSDIHGHLPFFQALMDKVALAPSDILIPLGDFLEKGRDSLALLRHLMELSQTHTLRPICGNCDELVLNFFETDEMDRRFFDSYLPRHPESAIRQMAREGGFEQLEDLPRLRADLRAAFPREWAWLKTLPTILETEHLVFVHGGVPSLEGMERLERWRCMKNDDFLGQGHAFDKWVIVGHWPVTLYDPHYLLLSPFHSSFFLAGLFLPSCPVVSLYRSCAGSPSCSTFLISLTTSQPVDFGAIFSILSLL